MRFAAKNGPIVDWRGFKYLLLALDWARSSMLLQVIRCRGMLCDLPMSVRSHTKTRSKKGNHRETMEQHSQSNWSSDHFNMGCNNARDRYLAMKLSVPQLTFTAHLYLLLPLARGFLWQQDSTSNPVSRHACTWLDLEFRAQEPSKFPPT